MGSEARLPSREKFGGSPGEAGEAAGRLPVATLRWRKLERAPGSSALPRHLAGGANPLRAYCSGERLPRLAVKRAPSREAPGDRYPKIEAQNAGRAQRIPRCTAPRTVVAGASRGREQRRLPSVAGLVYSFYSEFGEEQGIWRLAPASPFALREGAALTGRWLLHARKLLGEPLTAVRKYIRCLAKPHMKN